MQAREGEVLVFEVSEVRQSVPGIVLNYSSVYSAIKGRCSK